MNKNLFYYLSCLIAGLLFSIPALASSGSDSLELQLKGSSGIKKIDILNKLAVSFQFTGIEKSNSYAIQAYELADQINYTDGKALSLINRGEYYLSIDSISLAVQFIQRGLNLSKLSNYTYGVAFGEFHMAKVYLSFSDYNRSLTYYISALQKFDSIHDIEGKASSLRKIGDIQVELGNYDDAFNYYQDAMTLCEKLGNTEKIAILRSKLGLIHMAKKDLNQALIIFDLAITEFNNLGLNIEDLLYYKGQIFMEKKDFPNALKYFKQSAEIATKNNNYISLAENQFQLAQIYVQQKKYKDAGKYYRLSLAYSEKRHVKKLIANNYKGLSELYFALNNNLKAFEFQKLYASMKDSVLDEETNRAIHDLKLKYETEEIEKENEILKKNNLIQSLELSKQRYLTLIFISFVAISLIIVFFIINLYRNNRKTNALLRQKNQEINTQKSLLEDALSNLMRSEKKNRAILEAIPDMMFLLNEEGVFQEARADDFNHFGIEYNSISTKTINEIFPAKVAGQFIGAIKEVQKTKKLEVINFQLSINEEDKNFESRIVHKSEDIFLAITRDTTERIRLERNLIKAKEEAEDATKSKSMFLATMSHEIRTPMSGIIGMSEVMKDTPLNGKQKEYIDIIYTSANSLLSIINDILDFSKVEAGQLLLDNRPFNLRDVVHETTNMLLLKAQDKGIGLFTSIAHNVPPSINGDPNRLLQVLLNLTNNALKFTHQGSVTIEVTVEEIKQKVINLKFSIIDTGVGISDEDQNNLFKPFFQTESGRISKSEGTGLGLSIVKNLVSLMKGQVGIKSKSGEGSTFWFIAEFGFEENIVEVQTPTIAAVSPTQSLIPLRVLIAEDDPINQRLISIVIQRAGFDFDIASNGLEAVELFKKNNYDIVLMDIDMPKMDGVEATIHIREYENSIKAKHKIGIIAVTAKAVESDRTKCLQTGMNDYITKPFKPKDLLESIQKHKTQ